MLGESAKLVLGVDLICCNRYIIMQLYMCNNICDRAWENRSYLHILYFEKYEFEILNALLFSCGTIQSRQLYYINSVVI